MEVQIYEKYNDIIKEHKPQLIYKNYNIISKFLTSVLETDISRVIVNSKSIYSSIEKYIKEIHKENIEIDYREENLMQMYDLQEQLGSYAGVVSPFGLMNSEEHNIKVYFDQDMLAEDPILTFHPNVNTHTIFIKTTDLMKFIKEQGYDPEIIDL